MTLTPDLLVHAYRLGAFPMADADGTINWYAPDPRGVLPLDAFHVPKSLARVVQQERFRVTVDQAFEAVMEACAEPAPGREQTWISDEIASAYSELARLGIAHSVECWADNADGVPQLAGGLYGVALGAAFFGESMFHRQRDASKVALVHLVERLRAGGFVLLDTQMTTPHLERFGVVEISRLAYERQLEAALQREATWGGVVTPRLPARAPARRQLDRRQLDRRQLDRRQLDRRQLDRRQLAPARPSPARPSPARPVARSLGLAVELACVRRPHTPQSGHPELVEATLSTWGRRTSGCREVALSASRSPDRVRGRLFDCGRRRPSLRMTL